MSLSILVPHDGSRLSEAILPYLPSLGDVSVTLLRVIGHADSAADHDRARLAAEVELVGAGTSAGAFGLAGVRTRVGHGRPAEAIVSAAVEIGASLIAMTTHGRTGFDRLILGSVAEKVVRSSPVPVLVLRAASDPPPSPGVVKLLDRIFVPFDGSALAWRAVEALAGLGAAGKGLLVMLGVVAPRHPERREALHADVASAVARARDLGFDAVIAIEEGRPAAKVLDRAEAWPPATLIAMGTHGRSGVTRWALGSVTEQVLRVSSIPLLVCR